MSNPTGPIRYRVMVTSVISNDGDVATYCHADNGGQGLGQRLAETMLVKLTAAVTAGTLIAAWLEPIQ